eukprot:291244_1
MGDEMLIKHSNLFHEMCTVDIIEFLFLKYGSNQVMCVLKSLYFGLPVKFSFINRILMSVNGGCTNMQRYQFVLWYNLINSLNLNHNIQLQSLQLEPQANDCIDSAFLRLIQIDVFMNNRETCIKRLYPIEKHAFAILNRKLAVNRINECLRIIIGVLSVFQGHYAEVMSE